MSAKRRKAKLEAPLPPYPAWSFWRSLDYYPFYVYDALLSPLCVAPGFKTESMKESERDAEKFEAERKAAALAWRVLKIIRSAKPCHA